MLKIRLCDEDRTAYGGPEWLILDPERIRDLPVEDLEEMEQEAVISIGSILEYVTDDMAPSAVKFRRACAWIALRVAGEEVPWGKFLPRILRAEFTWQAGPPDGPSAPSSAAPESAPISGP